MILITKYDMFEFVSRSDLIITDYSYSIGVSDISYSPKVQVSGYNHKSKQIIEYAQTQTIAILYHQTLAREIYQEHRIQNCVLSRDFYYPLAKLIAKHYMDKS